MLLSLAENSPNLPTRRLIMTGPSSIKKRSGALNVLKLPPICQIPKISSFGDNSLDNIRDKG